MAISALHSSAFTEIVDKGELIDIQRLHCQLQPQFCSPQQRLYSKLFRRHLCNRLETYPDQTLPTIPTPNSRLPISPLSTTARLRKALVRSRHSRRRKSLLPLPILTQPSTRSLLPRSNHHFLPALAIHRPPSSHCYRRPFPGLPRLPLQHPQPDVRRGFWALGDCLSARPTARPRQRNASGSSSDGDVDQRSQHVDTAVVSREGEVVCRWRAGDTGFHRCRDTGFGAGGGEEKGEGARE
jgi:hypothetical protein